MAGFALVATVPIGVAADAAGPAAPAPGLRASGDSLGSRIDSATLELYALETQLARARASLDSLAVRRAEVGRERAQGERRLRIARRALTGSQSQLALLVRALYEEPQGDLLSVVLGADSLEEALAGLDGLSRAAGQSSRIIDQARLAGRRLEQIAERLQAREAELGRLVAAAQARTQELARTAAARKRFVAGLREEQRLNASRVAAIEADARRAGQRTVTVAADAASEASAAATAPAAEVAPAEAAPVTLDAAPGLRTLTVSATGYVLRGRTATGIPTAPGVVAVDPAVIPLGSRITIPGYGTGIAADTGGSIQGGVIDLWFSTLEEAHAWGRRIVTITVH
jgi:3D (Asp-Asp-Asp) domain-containing protein